MFLQKNCLLIKLFFMKMLDFDFGTSGQKRMNILPEKNCNTSKPSIVSSTMIFIAK